MIGDKRYQIPDDDEDLSERDNNSANYEEEQFE